MLTREEFQWQFKLLNFASKLCFLPLNVNLNPSIFPISSGILKWRRLVYTTIFILVHVHCIFSSIRLIQSLIWMKSKSKSVNPEHLVVHGTVVFAEGVVLMMNHPLFWLQREIPVIIFNELFNPFFTLAELPSNSYKNFNSGHKNHIKKSTVWKERSGKKFKNPVFLRAMALSIQSIVMRGYAFCDVIGTGIV